jgi:hypothetical protein
MPGIDSRFHRTRNLVAIRTELSRLQQLKVWRGYTYFESTYELGFYSCEANIQMVFP